MTVAYQKRLTVEAEQFWPGKKPWPEGVLDDADPNVYWLDQGGGYGVIRLCPGDWAVTNGETYIVTDRELCTAAMFPERYKEATP